MTISRSCGRPMRDTSDSESNCPARLFTGYRQISVMCIGPIGCDGKAAMCRNTPRLLGSGHFASFPAGPESPHAAHRTRRMRSTKEEDKAFLCRAPFSLAGHLSLWRAAGFVSCSGVFERGVVFV